jgi:hypothetical protein
MKVDISFRSDQELLKHASGDPDLPKRKLDSKNTIRLDKKRGDLT